MNKVDFTDIYKFLVSAGMAVIVFAIILPYLIFSNNFTFTITAKEISEFSPIGQSFIGYQQSYLLWIAQYYLYITTGLFFIGFFLTGGGIWGWYKRQQMRNDKEDAEAKTAKREWEKIENKETREKLVQELTVYFGFENTQSRDVVQPLDFEYILAKYTGSRNSLIDLIRFAERYVQNYGYQILVDWKLGSFNYDVIIKPTNEKINIGQFGQRSYRVYAIKYAEQNPSTEWIQKVLAELWLSANAYREKNKVNSANATLIVLSPSTYLESTIKDFKKTLPAYWQHQIPIKLIGVSVEKLEDLFIYHKNRDENDLEYRRKIFEKVFGEFDPEFIKELELEQKRIDKSQLLKETKNSANRNNSLLILGKIAIISGLIWIAIAFGKILISNLPQILNYMLLSIFSPTAFVSIGIAVLIILIIYQISIRTNKVSGTLYFVDGSEEIAQFGLYSGINWRKIKSKELDQYPQLGLRGMTVQNMGKKRRASSTGDDMGYMLQDGMSGVRVDYVAHDGRKFRVVLDPEIPTIYSDDGLGMMLYEPVEE
jgi:hypothetical protein